MMGYGEDVMGYGEDMKWDCEEGSGIVRDFDQQYRTGLDWTGLDCPGRVRDRMV